MRTTYSKLRSPLIALLALATAAPATAALATAQNEAATSSRAGAVRMQDVMAGLNLPLVIAVKDLNRDYRRVIIGGQSDMMGLQMRMMGVMAGVEFGLYFTKGQTISLGGETYLIAYRPQTRIDPQAFQNRGHGNDTPPEPTKLSPNTRFALSLLNLRSTDSLNDIRPFDPKQDIEGPQETNAASTRNLQRLGQGILTYLNARGRGVLPQLGARLTPASKRAFYPFVHDQRLWLHPATDEPYRPNPLLSGKRVNQILNRQFVALIYEAMPATDGTRGVLFLDGRVERVTPERWQRIQNAKPMMSKTRQTRATNSRSFTTAGADSFNPAITTTTTVIEVDAAP